MTTNPLQTPASQDPSPAPANPFAGMPALDVTIADVVVALVTFGASLAVLWCGMSAIVPFPVALLLHLGVVGIAATYLGICLRRGGELTSPVLLLVATAVSGRVGAAGCVFTALALW